MGEFEGEDNSILFKVDDDSFYRLEMKWDGPEEGWKKKTNFSGEKVDNITSVSKKIRVVNRTQEVKESRTMPPNVHMTEENNNGRLVCKFFYKKEKCFAIFEQKEDNKYTFDASFAISLDCKYLAMASYWEDGDQREYPDITLWALPLSLE